jgi:hypothetical protein
MALNLSEHKLAKDEEARLAPQLAKTAEDQLKMIGTALKQYKTKHHESFPVKTYEEKEWEGANGFMGGQEKTARAIELYDGIGFVHMKSIPNGLLSNGEPNLDPYYYEIMGNRLWSCHDADTTIGYKPRSPLVAEWHVPGVAPGADDHYTHADPDRMATYDLVNRICISVTAPRKILGFSLHSNHTYDKPTPRRAWQNGQFLPLTPAQLKAYQSEEPYYGKKQRVEGSTNAVLWEQVAQFLTHFQQKLQSVTQESKARAESAKEILKRAQEHAQTPFTL